MSWAPARPSHISSLVANVEGEREKGKEEYGVEDTHGLGNRETWFESHLCHLLAMEPWVRCLIVLGPNVSDLKWGC